MGPIDLEPQKTMRKVFFSTIRQSELYVSKKRHVQDIISYIYHALRAWKKLTQIERVPKN